MSHDGRRARIDPDGGRPKSLARTVEVVEAVLADRGQFAQLVTCSFSDDDVVRLRNARAMKRVTTARPDWTIEYLNRLQWQVGALDQASTQWTFALLFDLTKELLHDCSRNDPPLAAWLRPHLERLSTDRRKSVENRAAKLQRVPSSRADDLLPGARLSR